MVSGQSPRGGKPDPYAGMETEQVLALAQGCLRKAEALPPTSSARRKQWKVFDRAMGELMRRAMMETLWKLHEQETGREDDAELAGTIIELAERDKLDDDAREREQ